MNVDKARSWFHRANASFQAFQEAEQRIAECEVKIEQAEIMGSKRLVERWRSELEFAQMQLQATEKQLQTLTQTSDRHAAVNCLVDMAVRFEELNSKHEEWRRTLAVQQFIELDSDAEVRTEAVQMVELAHDMYVRAQRLIVQAIPHA